MEEKIDIAINWLSALDVSSEYESSSKEVILSELYKLQKDNKIKHLKDKIEKDINKFSNNKNEVFMTQSSQIDASLISYCNELLDILEGNL